MCSSISCGSVERRGPPSGAGGEWEGGPPSGAGGEWEGGGGGGGEAGETSEMLDTRLRVRGNERGGMQLEGPEALSLLLPRLVPSRNARAPATVPLWAVTRRVRISQAAIKPPPKVQQGSSSTRFARATFHFLYLVF